MTYSNTGLLYAIAHRRPAVALSHSTLSLGPRLNKQLLSRTLSVLVAKGWDSVMNYPLALKASAWKWHPSLLLTFQWPKQVTWPPFTPARPRSHVPEDRLTDFWCRAPMAPTLANCKHFTLSLAKKGLLFTVMCLSPQNQVFLNFFSFFIKFLIGSDYVILTQNLLLGIDQSVFPLSTIGLCLHLLVTRDIFAENFKATCPFCEGYLT